MVDNGFAMLTSYFFASFLGKKEVQDHREQLSLAKRYAESIAVITPELAKEFLEVCLYFDLNVKHHTLNLFFFFLTFICPSPLFSISYF